MKEGSVKVTVVIPHYRDGERLSKLLPGIASQTFKDYEVVIIDDCSQDDDVMDHIRAFIKDYDNISLLQNNENMLFVKTCNRGIKVARGEYICLLNSDTEVAGDFLARNVEVMDCDPSIGVLSCIIVDQHGNNWFSGGRFQRGDPVNLKDDFEGIRCVDFVAGTAIFYRRELFDKVGLLDEKYIMYHEDVEFGLRVKAKTDYELKVLSDKLVTHYIRYQDSGPPDLFRLNRIFYYGHRNHILFLKQYSPAFVPWVIVRHLWRITTLLVMSALSILIMRPRSCTFRLGQVRSIAKATIDGLRG